MRLPVGETSGEAKDHHDAVDASISDGLTEFHRGSTPNGRNPTIISLNWLGDFNLAVGY